MYPVVSRRAAKRRMATKITEILINPFLSGQELPRSSVLLFFQTLIKRAIDISTIAIPRRNGKNPGPGLSMAPIEYFLDSKMRKAPNTTNKTLLIFSETMDLVPQRFWIG
jgi:hypothetical protein